ncbi:MAG: hypothetical protein KF851_19525 [Pirellulaceae bacterium]|nr:hypothetical protein [Pirellulaceae bacterium]
MILIVVMGFIDLCCLMLAKAAICHASRDAVRACVVDGKHGDEGAKIIEDQLIGFGIKDAIVSITPSPEQTFFGQPISVDIEVEFKRVSWLGKGSVFQNVVLQTKATMRSERLIVKR